MEERISRIKSDNYSKWAIKFKDKEKTIRFGQYNSFFGVVKNRN